MNKKAFIKKILIYCAIVAVVLVAGILVYGKKATYVDYPDMTTYSAKEKGVKALYLLVEQMGYSVERFEQSAKHLPAQATLVAVNPEKDVLNESKESMYLKEWVKSGNTLVIIDDDLYPDEVGLSELKTKEPVYLDENNIDCVYKFGSGNVVFLDGYLSYTNKGLKSYDAGLRLVEVLDKSNRKRVLFNEYYHGFGSDENTVWGLLGPVGQIMVIQLLIALLLYMYVLSRRFGKPVTVFEIIKRKENENLLALSNIYTKAKANSLVLETYLDNLKNELRKFLGLTSHQDEDDIIIAASDNKFLSSMNTKEVIYACNHYIKNDIKDTKLLCQLAEKVEKIRKGIK